MYICAIRIIDKIMTNKFNVNFNLVTWQLPSIVFDYVICAKNLFVLNLGPPTDVGDVPC